MNRFSISSTSWRPRPALYSPAPQSRVGSVVGDAGHKLAVPVSLEVPSRTDVDLERAAIGEIEGYDVGLAAPLDRHTPR